jgi:type IV fimbrial biogenesis protein FimT
MNRLQKGVAGFTLPELMITVALVAILASLAVPAYSTFVEKRRITGGAEGIAAFMMLARSEAVKQNQQTTVSFYRNPDDSTDWCLGMTLGDTACDCTISRIDEDEGAGIFYCELEYTDGNGNSISSGAQLISSSEYSGFQLTAATTGSGDTALTYDPIRGILDDPTDISSITIQSSSSVYELTINVSPTGTVKTCTNTSKMVTGFKSC